MTTSAPLYLLHTQPDARLLSAWMARYRTHDLGDALHGLLRAAFGEHAPQPFCYLDEHRGLLAYTLLDAQAMAEQVALADDLISSFAGGGIASKLSRRFGEGVVNGALTARIGIAAMELCRPLPFRAAARPSASALVARALAGMIPRGGKDAG